MDATAVEPPELPQSTRRRHKPITSLSGLVLLCCIVMPAVKGCHEPIYPITLPPVWPPYLLGMGFAIAALSGIRAGAITLRVVCILTAVGGGLITPFVPEVGIVELLIGLVLTGIIGLSGASERRVVALGVVVGGLSIAWFGGWTSTRDALFGSYVALASSIGLVVGSLVWIYDLVVAGRPEIPQARVIS